jgi:hypothetical protein
VIQEPANAIFISMRTVVLGGLLAVLVEAQTVPPVQEQEGLIAAVRQNALDYNHGLADFLCTQVTRRYSSKPVNGQAPDWKQVDTLTMRVSYFQQKEDYRVVKVNDKAVNKSFEQVGGHRTEGEFGSILQGVFAAKSKAKFKWERGASEDGRPVAVYSYRIERKNSTFVTNVRRLLRYGSYTWGAGGPRGKPRSIRRPGR